MNQKFQKLWKEAELYLAKGVMKDFVLHTEGVVKAMEMLIDKEGGNEDVLIPAAILHDIGWAKVPHNLQKSKVQEEKIEAMKLHIDYAPELVGQIISKFNFDDKKKDEIIEVVVAHKFQNPEDKEKRMLIDADTMADAFRDQFYSDVASYANSPMEQYNFRTQNKFYFKSAEEIFWEELNERKEEFGI